MNRVSILSISCLLIGCAAFGGGGAPCAQYEEQPYQVEVCDNRSETGWCTARHYEQRSRSVCVRRESANVTEPRGGSPMSNFLVALRV